LVRNPDVRWKIMGRVSISSNNLFPGPKGEKGDKGDTGATGATGATGSTGATGPQGPSGVVTVNAPITNSGTSSAANLSVSAGTTSAAGILQLTDSTSSTSTTTAATPNSVKTAYDLANSKQPYDWFAMPKFIAGKYYTTDAGVTAGSVSTQSRLYLLPFWVHTTETFDRIGIRVTATAASSVIRLGIYSANSNYEPTSLVLDAGTVDSATAISSQEITISQQLTPGMYFLAAVPQGGAPSFQTIGNNPLSIPGFSSIPFSSVVTNQAILTTYIIGSITGALPSTFNLAGSTVTTGAPRVFLRAS